MGGHASVPAITTRDHSDLTVSCSVPYNSSR